jgi:hypothetical protein
VTVTVLDANSNPISGVTPTYSMTGTLNTLGACAATDAFGQSICSVTSTKAEAKTVSLLTPVAVSGNMVDFNPNGINLMVPIEMADRGLSSNTTAITFARTRTSLNPADYVGATADYFFEIVADNTNTTTAYIVTIVDSANIAITTANITVPASTTAKRFRVLFTPNSAADNYRVKVAATAIASQVKVHSARIIVEQTAATATKIYIPLAGSDFAGESNNDTTTATITSTTSTTFIQPTANLFYQWTRTDANYDAIAATNPYTLETVMRASVATATVSAAIYDKANNLQITQATTSVTGTTATTMAQASFNGAATNFNDGDIMELRIKTTSGTGYLMKAGLWMKLKFLKKAEVYQRISTRRSLTTSAALPDARFFWDAIAWSNPTVFFQAYTQSSVASGSTVVLMDHATNDNGTTSPTTITTFTPGTTYATQRSTALTLTDQDRFFVQHNRVSGTATLGGAFMVIKVTE